MAPSSPPDRLDLGDGRRIAYRRVRAAAEDGRAGVVFLPGFRSDMTGTKAAHLADWAARTGRACLRFDYSGHGESAGAFEDGAISDWADDAYEAVTRLTEGRQVIVGSSMGGWIALLLLRRLAGALGPEGFARRVAGFVGVAAAPDFTEDLMWARFTPSERAAIETRGRLELPSAYGAPTPITRRLIEDGRANLVLRAPLALPVPVRLLQGEHDADVPVETALRLLAHLDGVDARLTIVKGADHRLSAPADLALLEQTVAALTG